MTLKNFQRGKIILQLFIPARCYVKCSILTCITQGRYISDITLEEVQQYTDVPAHVACERLGLGLTSFKRLCRGLGISAWPYKKDASVPSPAHGSEYGVGALTGSPNDGFNWPRPPKIPSGHLPSTSAQPAPVSLSSIPQNPVSTAAQFSYSTPQLTGWPQATLLQNLLRDATATSLAQLMGQIKQFSAEMRLALGVSIINDDAVDLIKVACVAMESANQTQQQQQQQQQQQRQQLPPLENNAAAALMALLAQIRGSLQPK